MREIAERLQDDRRRSRLWNKEAQRNLKEERERDRVWKEAAVHMQESAGEIKRRAQVGSEVRMCSCDARSNIVTRTHAQKIADREASQRQARETARCDEVMHKQDRDKHSNTLTHSQPQNTYA